MQAMGIWYTPDMMRDFPMVREQIKKAKNANFDILIAFFRWMHINCMHAEAIKTTELSVGYAHELGMKFMVDTDPTWWQTDFTETYPDAALRVLVRGETAATGGKFSHYFAAPGAVIVHVQEMFDKVVAVFVEEGAAKYRFVDPAECDIHMEVGRAQYGLGHGTERTPFNRVTGSIPGRGNRKVILYGAYKTFSYVDFAHPDFLAESKRLLDMYAHIPLDGVGWDEPGRVGGMQGAYRGGNAFMEFFKERKGYDLAPNLIRLDGPCDDAHGIKVRHDYYDAMTEMNIAAQSDHFEYAKKLYGDDILLGTHQTWTPLGDIAIGYGDYFRTGKVLNPVWVDVFTQHEENWQSFNEMLHVYCLGDSLRKEYGRRRVYSNDYFEPVQPDQIGFYTRMKMLFDISWFNLWVGEHTEYMTNLDDRHAPEIAQAAKSLNDFQEFTGDDYRIQADTAVLYSPKGLYAFPSVNFGLPSESLLHMRYHLVRHFLRAGRCFDFVGECSLARAEVGDGELRIDDRTYRRLVLPWVACIAEPVRSHLGAISEKGVQVVYAGPPAVRVAETGQDISEEFFRMFDLDSFTLGDFLRFAQQPCPKAPDYYGFSHRAYPLSGANAHVLGMSHDGDPSVVQARTQPHVIYDSSLDTLNRATYDLMSDTKEPGVRVHVNNGYYRVFENVKKPNAWLIVVAADMRSRLDAYIATPRDSLMLQGGGVAALRIEDGRIIREPMFTDGAEIVE